jgi:hypothetical protein
LTRIGSSAFSLSSLQSIVIPRSVQFIEWYHSSHIDSQLFNIIIC